MNPPHQEPPGETQDLLVTTDPLHRRGSRVSLLVSTAVLGMAILVTLMLFATQRSSRPVNFSPDLTARPSFGPADAPRVVAVYTDYQCPACARFRVEADPQLRSLVRQRGDTRIVYLHRILFGAGSLKAAIAADCAYQNAGLDGYDRMSLQLYAQSAKHGERDSSWLTPANLTRMARTAGVAGPAFQACFQHPATTQAVKRQSEALEQAGGHSTPAVFVNGQGVVPTFSATVQALDRK